MPMIVDKLEHVQTYNAPDGVELKIRLRILPIPGALIANKQIMNRYQQFIQALTWGSASYPYEHGFLTSDKLLELAQRMHEIELAEAALSKGKVLVNFIDDLIKDEVKVKFPDDLTYGTSVIDDIINADAKIKQKEKINKIPITYGSNPWLMAEYNPGSLDWLESVKDSLEKEITASVDMAKGSDKTIISLLENGKLIHGVLQSNLNDCTISIHGCSVPMKMGEVVMIAGVPHQVVETQLMSGSSTAKIAMMTGPKAEIIKKTEATKAKIKKSYGDPGNGPGA